MNMRDRLIALLKGILRVYVNDVAYWHDEQYGALADHLIANGVIVPPCKVGDTVYRVYTKSWIGEDKICEISISRGGVFYVDDKGRETSCEKIGKTVFLTREEAELALKEKEK